MILKIFCLVVSKENVISILAYVVKRLLKSSIKTTQTCLSFQTVAGAWCHLLSLECTHMYSGVLLKFMLVQLRGS